MPHVPVPVIQLVDGFATEEHPGGAAQFAIQLARQLDRARFAPHVVGLWRYDTPSERRWLATLASEGIPTSILVEQRKRLSADLLRAATHLRMVIDRTGAQIINSHFERGDLLALAAKLTTPQALRIVRTQHTDQQWQQRPWLGALLNTVALPWLFDVEVAISAATRDALDARPAARLRHRHSTLIYNGLNRSVMQHLANARGLVGLRTVDAPHLLVIGRLAPQKGHADALVAIAEVLERHPHAKLSIVGHGELRAELEQQAESLGIASAVQFLGQRNDIPLLLAQADMLVSSSLWEGFPTVVLEAMAAGVPVVATDVSGSRELVENGLTGLLVLPRLPHLLARAIMHMLDDPKATKAMAARAQQQVQHYTFERIAAIYAKRYEQLVALS